MDTFFARNLLQGCVTKLWLLVLVTGVTEAATVTTRSGKVQGFTQKVGSTSVNTFLGIPFAEPPLGPLRFRPPVPVAEWSGVKNALTMPNSCMQSVDTSFGRFKGVEMWNPNTNISEDCLYLNLWVPVSNEGNKLTTIVWIYGGAFVSGSSALPVYDGTYLAAQKSVIVASMQYRVGVHGFLYSGTDDAPGNMGLLDQQMAMKWIYDNIELFGGDVRKITLMGESAGAGSVSLHLLAQSSWLYFNNAIMQSGSPLAPWASESSTIALGRFEAFIKRVECDRSDTIDIFQCLRSKDIEVLEKNQYVTGGVEFRPVEGTAFLKDAPEKLIKSGEIKAADIIIGNTKDEGEYFFYYSYPNIFKPENLWDPQPLSRVEYLELVKDLGDGVAETMTGLLHTYEFSKLPSDRGSFMDIIDDMSGDKRFKCPVHDFATQFSNQIPKKGRTYVYSFEYRHSANPWPAWMGVLHGYEVEMAFGLPFNPNLNYSAEDRIVSENMIDYFVTFAETGSPNSGNTPTVWPEFSQDTEKHIVFNQDTTTEAKQGYRRMECSFWKLLSPLLTDAQEHCSSSGSGHLLSSSTTATYLAALFILKLR